MPRTTRLEGVGFWPAWGGVFVLATGNFLVGLGGSSLFVDEAFSWTVSSAPVRDLYAQVKLSEVAPPGYYAGLHVWMTIGGSESEAWMRGLSALAGIGVVAAVIWLANIIGGRRAATAAGLLAALSPLVLRYAQEARAFIFVMLAVTVAVAAATCAVDERGHHRRWLAVAIAASVAALWLHYTSLLVIVPLALWVVTRAELSLRAKLLYSASVVGGQAVVTPIMLSQLAADNPGAARFGGLTFSNALNVVGTPLDGRYAHSALLSFAGAAATLAACVILMRQREGRLRHGRLIAALTAGPIAALFVVTLLSEDVLLSRYSAVCAPFAVVAIAGATQLMRPRFGMAALGTVAALAGVGSLASHHVDSHHPDIGGAFDYAGERWRPDDLVLVAPSSAFDLTSAPLLNYYRERALPERPEVVAGADSPQVKMAFRRRRRIWILRDPPVSRSSLTKGLRGIRYRLVAAATFRGMTDVQMVLTEPMNRRH